MTLSIIALSPDEKFLQHIDPDLCKIKETITKDGLRTIDFEYRFQDYISDKQLFKLGNKLWIQGDINLTDALYVINTKIKEDIYKDNSFSFDAEEVLVELNNAPLVSHLDFTTHTNVFKKRTVNDSTGELEVKIDWNSLNYWFGDFFNLGVVQDCLNSNLQWIPFFGTYNLMNLLRFIETQTGNVFVTRYEKDPLNNIIHRYLDFLNPISVSKNWELHLEYDFAQSHVRKYYEDDGTTETTEDKPWEVVRYTNSHVPINQDEQVLNPTYDSERDEATRQYDTLDTTYIWNPEDENVIDEGTINHYTTLTNIVPANTQFQICTPDGRPLNADGTIYTTGDDNPLIWSCSDIGLSTSNTNCLISIYQDANDIGIALNNRSFSVSGGVGGNLPTYVAYTNSIHENADSENVRSNSVLPDDCYLEIYDSVNKVVVFRTQVNRSIGTVHEEVLDFGFNINNIQYDIDEENIYSAVAPVLQYNENNSSSNSLTRSNFTDLLTRYLNLSISKGDKIPMIMQRITVKASSLANAMASLGTVSASNYWIRPYKPQDSIDSNTPSNSTFEFLRATAYWYAPYDKKAGSLEVSLNDSQGIEYPNIYGRNDTREDKGTLVYNKTGTTESSDEDIYSIYNQCALFLKEHSTPNIELDVDVSNFQNCKYNDYNLHDKIYIKIPGTSELITARVIETSKEANNIAANTIKLSNYTNNTLKQITSDTLIHASNTSFKYPGSKTLQVRLENLAYDSEDPYSVQYPANKLISFTLYKVKDGQRTFSRIYTKKTNAYGYASLNMKYNPADWEMDISFAGDEEYTETTTTIKINVSGTVATKTNNKSSNKSKTTAKTEKKVTKTTYYDKYGRSPDKKKLLAIGKPSASGDEGNYDFYGMEFKNYCPHCGQASLAWGIFYAGNEYSNWGTFPATGNREGGSAEGHIFCTNQKCDADYSCQGHEHISGGKKLTVTKKRFKSSKADAYKLKKGKYVYNQASTSNSSKNNSNNKTRKVIGKISTTIKNKALEIVGEKTGYQAMRAVCDWMDHHIKYKGYGGFVYSPESVLKSKHGNCCDQTRLILQLFDGAGLSEYYDMYYVHVHEHQGHVYAQIRNKKTGTRTYIDPASNAYDCYGYVCQGYSRGSPASKYPNKPF